MPVPGDDRIPDSRTVRKGESPLSSSDIRDHDLTGTRRFVQSANRTGTPGDLHEVGQTAKICRRPRREGFITDDWVDDIAGVEKFDKGPPIGQLQIARCGEGCRPRQIAPVAPRLLRGELPRRPPRPPPTRAAGCRGREFDHRRFGRLFGSRNDRFRPCAAPRRSALCSSTRRRTAACSSAMVMGSPSAIRRTVGLAIP